MFVRPYLPMIRARFGYPYHLWMTQEFDEAGWNAVQKSLSQKRAHDITLFIRGVGGQFALMSKHTYPPGVFRSPSGGLQPGEDFEIGARREALEETGLNVHLSRFFVHITLDITHEAEVCRWDSYVFIAETRDHTLAPRDRKEVRDTLWASRKQLENMNERLMETQNGGLIYRARLTSAFLWALDHELTFRESRESDFLEIKQALRQAGLPSEGLTDRLWWSAEINGLWAGAVSLVSYPDAVEIDGLTVARPFRGRGVGYALTEYAVDRFREIRDRAWESPLYHSPPSASLWLWTELPGYFLPLGFRIADGREVPDSLRQRAAKYHLKPLIPMKYKD